MDFTILFHVIRMLQVPVASQHSIYIENQFPMPPNSPAILGITPRHFRFTFLPLKKTKRAILSTRRTRVNVLHSLGLKIYTAPIQIRPCIWSWSYHKRVLESLYIGLREK